MHKRIWNAGAALTVAVTLGVFAATGVPLAAQDPTTETITAPAPITETFTVPLGSGTTGSPRTSRAWTFSGAQGGV